MKKHTVYIHTWKSKLGKSMSIIFLVSLPLFALSPFSWEELIFQIIMMQGMLLWFFCKKEVKLTEKQYSRYIFEEIIGYTH